MKAKELQELREKGLEDLHQKERELGEQLFRLRLQQSVGRLDDALKLRRVRRDIARVKTILRQRSAPQGGGR